MRGQGDPHLGGLIPFGLKRGVFAENLHVSQLCLNGLFGQIASLGKGQTCPASFNPLQQTNQHDIPGPGIF